MDRVLHVERLSGRLKRKHEIATDDLPDAAMIELDGEAWAIRKGSLLQWTPSGYQQRQQRPANRIVTVLTPPSILEVLAQGYQPQWHTSAGNDVMFGPKSEILAAPA
jgi:hypothetical protein